MFCLMPGCSFSLIFSGCNRMYPFPVLSLSPDCKDRHAPGQRKMLLPAQQGDHEIIEMRLQIGDRLAFEQARVEIPAGDTNGVKETGLLHLKACPTQLLFDLFPLITPVVAD